MSEPERLGQQYSRAFETFVEGSGDLVGLIAYALYKQNLREVAAAGRQVPPAIERRPTQTESSAYRGDAERLLQTFAAQAVKEATPGIVAEGVGSAVGAARGDLEKLIRQRTSIGAAIWTNLVAWVITLAITVLIVTAFYLPNWQASLVDRLRAVYPPNGGTGAAVPPRDH